MHGENDNPKNIWSAEAGRMFIVSRLAFFMPAIGLAIMTGGVFLGLYLAGQGDTPLARLVLIAFCVFVPLISLFGLIDFQTGHRQLADRNIQLGSVKDIVTTSSLNGWLSGTSSLIIHFDNGERIVLSGLIDANASRTAMLDALCEHGNTLTKEEADDEPVRVAS